MCHGVVKLMVTERDGIVVHGAHYIRDVLATGNGTCCTALYVVSTADHCHESGIGYRITQACQFLVSVNGAVYIVLIENDNAFLRCFGFGRNAERQREKESEDKQILENA